MILRQQATQTRSLLCIIALMMASYAAWPFLQPHVVELKSLLIQFKLFCLSNRMAGYVIYSALLSLVLFIGLPVASAIMLLAGVTYEFWEAITLVTACRLAVAIGGFMLARRWVERPRRRHAQPYILEKFASYPKTGLFLARLAPIPDSVVSYSMAALPIRRMDYMLVSLIGMIPCTLAFVWMGNELGSISKLVRFLN